MIRILIVDDHPLIRTATRLMLETHGSFLIVGEASSGKDGAEMALKLMPEIILMDINMEPVNGITATRKIKAKNPSALIIGFSALPYKHQEQEMLNAGAVAVINKSALRSEICTQIIDLYSKYMHENR